MITMIANGKWILLRTRGVTTYWDMFLTSHEIQNQTVYFIFLVYHAKFNKNCTNGIFNFI